MKPLYSEKEFLFAKTLDKLPLTCLHCNATFFKRKKDIKESGKGLKNTSEYCSRFCSGQTRSFKQTVSCLECGKQIVKKRCELSVHNFCSLSCSCTYKNTHKTKACKVSKLELFLQTKLLEKYSDIEFHFNKTDAVNSELDIYIPSLKLAFELNGIFHYEPVYGPEKLQQIQTNDHKKLEACLVHNIALFIIDSSKFNHFTTKGALVYLDIVTDIIDKKLIGN